MLDSYEHLLKKSHQHHILRLFINLYSVIAGNTSSPEVGPAQDSVIVTRSTWKAVALCPSIVRETWDIILTEQDL